MKKSLKHVYKNLLKEEVTIDKNTPLKKFDETLNVYYGNFSEKSLSLWNEKDGSGGRGEYTVASHFLKSFSDSINFERIDLNKFFKDLSDNDKFYEWCEINKDEDLENTRKKIEENLKAVNIEIKTLSNSNLEKIKNREASPGIKFEIENKITNETASTFSTAIRLINKSIFLQEVESPEQILFYGRSEIGLYDLLSSVTTSGELSKSTDVYIENNRVNQEFISELNLGNKDLTIEVKEISSVTQTTTGSGIRLASGSTLAAMQNDIIFCLTIICIVTDIVSSDIEDQIGEYDSRGKIISLSLGNALESLKLNQIPSKKLSLLVNYIIENFEVLGKVLSDLISREAESGTKQSIARQALNHLEAIYSNMSKDERKVAINSSLDNIISKSIKADYLCVLNGWDSDVYKKTKNKIGKKQFLLIHKSAFDKVLGLSSYQNGGTAYTSIKDEEVANFLNLFFNPSAITEANYLLNNKALYLCERRQAFLDKLKKNTITEGGLAGHMMHPYEALDMTPREMIARIKEYGVPQSIIEKVDGQNLFFTVEKDGTLLFARNKEDMTHDDLVQKFTGHPAELPFVEGGNAIKRGVDQWLSSAGDFASQEILDIFHPDEETRSFINFEIMHPEKPNQIVYDEKYIVFHNITDFVDGREQVYSSSTDGRLQRLITLMESGVNSGGFVLASNREVDLNKLTDTQIARYIDRVKDVVDMLEISEDQYLADGILSVIDKELKSEGVNISEEALSILKDFVIYGQTKTGESIKSKDFTELMDKEDVVKLRKLGLTSATKVLGKVSKILSPFKDIFVDLGIDLLSGVKSSYMSAETSEENINVLRDKLQTAMNDLDVYMLSRDEEEYSNTVKRLIPHINKIKEAGLDKVISSSVEGGVYDYQADLIKVTGGFAPMNQILGAAYRDKEDIFPMFKEKFMQKEGNRKSLKDVFSLIY